MVEHLVKWKVGTWVARRDALWAVVMAASLARNLADLSENYSVGVMGMQKVVGSVLD